MNGFCRSDPEHLLRLAQQGDVDAVGRLLDGYRSYLLLLARLQIDRRMQGKIDASDLVQETFLHAHRAFGDFRGATEEELLAWLRRILASRLTDLLRRYATKRRNVRLECRLEEELDRSSRIAGALVLSESSPSQKTGRREQAVLVAEAIGRLPADYREVIVLRHLEELKFPEVARRMERSEGSVKKLWVRALANLRCALEGKTDDLP